LIVRPIVCRRFIGRQEELEYLHERRREAGSSHGGFVFVSGEAGVGKSRLLAEFRTSLAKSRVRIGVGASLEFAQRPYGPILDLLARFEPSAAELVPAASKREQFDAIAQAFVRAAERTTLVGIIEDLHWADAATLELLDYLASKLRATRTLIVASYRSGEHHPEHPTFAAIAKLTRAPLAGRIELAPLDAAELRLFIDAALDGVDLSHETRRAVAHASDGNPFFAEELLKSAVERLASERSTAEARFLPTTVRAALMERLRPLDDGERRVLAQAAVIGRRFDVGLLAETLGHDIDSLLSTLRRARDFQLVEEESAAVFRFRHALTREAIYGDFLAAQVRPLHRKIALVLEETSEDRRSIESLAYHWWAAGERTRAAQYNELAGDAAGRVYAHDDAVAYYERALESVDRISRECARLLEKIAQRRVVNGFNDGALAAYSEAAEILQQVGDADAEAECRVHSAIQSYRLGNPDPAAPLETMLARLGASDAARSRLHLGIAHLAALRYRPGEALRHLDEVEMTVTQGNPDLRYSYHATRAMVYYIVADIERFRAELDAWLAAAGDASNPGLAALVHHNGGMYLSILGRHEEAMAHFERALAVARKQRIRMAESAAYAMSALALLSTGDLEGVRRAVDAVRALPTDSEVALAHAAAWGTLAGLHLGDDSLIEHWFDRLHGTITELGAVIYAAGYAEILHRRGRIAEAQALLHRAIDYGEQPRGLFMTLLAVARIGAADDFPKARATLERAADAAAEVVERPALALFDALVERRKLHTASAAEHARTAAEGFRRLGYPLWEAAALEIAGERAAAFAIYRRTGALADVRRLEREGEIDAAATRSPAALVPGALSSREGEIAALVARGRSNLEIAHELSISHKTVEKHLGSIFQKLGLRSRTQLAALVSARTQQPAP
jgi:DNA-binding CsgD family transcriptional regulator/Tfp pilus assembly protein PilF